MACSALCQLGHIWQCWQLITQVLEKRALPGSVIQAVSCSAEPALICVSDPCMTQCIVGILCTVKSATHQPLLIIRQCFQCFGCKANICLGQTLHGGTQGFSCFKNSLLPAKDNPLPKFRFRALKKQKWQTILIKAQIPIYPSPRKFVNCRKKTLTRSSRTGVSIGKVVQGKLGVVRVTVVTQRHDCAVDTIHLWVCHGWAYAT